MIPFPLNFLFFDPEQQKWDVQEFKDDLKQYIKSIYIIGKIGCHILTLNITKIKLLTSFARLAGVVAVSIAMILQLIKDLLLIPVLTVALSVEFIYYFVKLVHSYSS